MDGPHLTGADVDEAWIGPSLPCNDADMQIPARSQGRSRGPPYRPLFSSTTLPAHLNSDPSALCWEAIWIATSSP